MRRYLVATQTGGVVSALKYEYHWIVDAPDPDEAVDKYNRQNDNHQGVSIAYISPDVVVKSVRSGPINETMLKYLYDRDALRPVRIEKDEE